MKLDLECDKIYSGWIQLTLYADFVIFGVFGRYEKFKNIRWFVCLTLWYWCCCVLTRINGEQSVISILETFFLNLCYYLVSSSFDLIQNNFFYNFMFGV